MRKAGDNSTSAFLETSLDHEVKFSGVVYRAVRHLVKLQDGSIQNREVVYHNGGAVIAAENAQGEFYIVRQYRFAAQMELLEFPAGKLEKGEAPLQCALRELEEECGCKAEEVIDLGYILPTPGYTSEKIYLFYAKNLVQTAQKLDEGEFLACETMSLEQLNALAAQGEIHDAKTLILLSKINYLKSL